MRKHGGKALTISLAASLAAISACAPVAGDFCDVADPLRFDADVAERVVSGDRETAERIDAHNTYGEKACGW